MNIRNTYRERIEIFCIIGVFVTLLGLAGAFSLGPRDVSAAVIQKLGTTTAGLVGWWTLDEGTSTIAHDFSGNNDTATFQNSPSWVSGKRGKAVAFDGSTQYLSVPDVPVYSFSTSQSFTLSTWANLSSFNSSWGGVVTRARTSGAFYGIWKSATNTWVFGTGAANIGTTPITPGWHHLVAVQDASANARYLYVDGSLVATGVGTVNGTGAGGLNIGRSDTGEYFPGKVDDVRIYNKALSAGDIQALYKSNETLRKQVTNGGLVGYLPFDEGTSTVAGDMSGNGNSGTLQGGAAWTSGKRGRALSFNGTTAYVDAGNPSAFQFTAASTFTLSAWIYPQTACASPDPIFDKFGSKGYRIFLDSGCKPILQIRDSGGTLNSALSSVGLALNTWSLVSVTFNAGVASIFINGQSVGVTDISSVTLADLSRNLYIGQSPNNSTFFLGKIDDVRIYSRVLTSAEISALYKQNQTKINAPEDTRMTNGLVGYWTFNGKDLTATQALDVSGQGNNATLTNAPQPMIGKVGQALAFNGSNTYVVSSKLGTSLPNLTLSVWVKADPSGGLVFDELGQGAINTGWHDPQMEVETNGTVKMCVWTGASSCVTASGSFAYREWHHLVMTFSATGGLLSSYVDGVAGPTASYTKQNPNTSSIFFSFGNNDTQSAGNAVAFSGALDEVRIYNRALSAAEVQQLYLIGK